jgi:hypothetical protein
MIGDGVLHSLDYVVNPPLNLRELFGGGHILALIVFFRLVGFVNGEQCCSVRDPLLLDGVDATLRLTLGKPVFETGEGGGSGRRKWRVQLPHLFPYEGQVEASFA